MSCQWRYATTKGQVHTTEPADAAAASLGRCSVHRSMHPCAIALDGHPERGVEDH